MPITALRLTPPSSSAIWLAVAPSCHIFFRRSMRSSVQDIVKLCSKLRLRLVPPADRRLTRERPANASPSGCASPPGDPVLMGVNWGGLKTLYIKEVRRFFKVQMQTVWAPAITTLLYLAIFTVALGRGGRTVMGLPFADFIAPGLIVMAMMQNAFANSSFSLLVGKIQGNIVDYLMPPLSTGRADRRAGRGGGDARVPGRLRGVAGDAAVAGRVGRGAPAGAGLVVRADGRAAAGFLGLLTSLWAEKFDHAAAVTNFVVTPLSLLSGTFYSVRQLSPTFQAVSHANPFFYVISGFRAGFLGVSDSPLLVGAIGLLVLNLRAVGGLLRAPQERLEDQELRANFRRLDIELNKLNG